MNVDCRISTEITRSTYTPIQLFKIAREFQRQNKHKPMIKSTTPKEQIKSNAIENQRS